MTQQPTFSDAEFIDAEVIGTELAAVYNGYQDDISTTHTAGLVNAPGVSVTASGMVLTITCPTSFAAIFGNGFIGKAHGITDGIDTQVTVLDLTPFVPVGSTSLVYITLSGTGVNENIFTISGPPSPHPDYDPTLVPTTAYDTRYSTLLFSASVNAPDNVSTLEFARVTLTPGQTSVSPSSLVLTSQVRAGSILNKTGVVAGTYTSPTITITDDGRITAATSAPPVVPGHLIAVATFVGGGIFTPPAGTNFIEIEINGAGGGGAASTDVLNSGANISGGGGGGGSWAKVYFAASSYTMPMNYNVGVGGTAGIPVAPLTLTGRTGGVGGVSQVLDAKGVNIVSCPGGQGGPCNGLHYVFGGAAPTIGTNITATSTAGGNGDNNFATTGAPAVSSFGGSGGGCTGCLGGSGGQRSNTTGAGNPGVRGGGGAGGGGTGPSYPGSPGGDGFIRMRFWA